MTVIVQQSTDSNGNPQPMVYDSDTKKIIVDSEGYVLNGGSKLINVPTRAEYLTSPKTQTSGIQEALSYINNNNDGKIVIKKGLYPLSVPLIYNIPTITKLGNTAPTVISPLNLQGEAFYLSQNKETLAGTVIYPTSAFPSGSPILTIGGSQSDNYEISFLNLQFLTFQCTKNGVTVAQNDYSQNWASGVVIIGPANGMIQNNYVIGANGDGMDILATNDGTGGNTLVINNNIVNASHNGIVAQIGDSTVAFNSIFFAGQGNPVYNNFVLGITSSTGSAINAIGNHINAATCGIFATTGDAFILGNYVDGDLPTSNGMSVITAMAGIAIVLGNYIISSAGLTGTSTTTGQIIALAGGSVYFEHNTIALQSDILAWTVIFADSGFAYVHRNNLISNGYSITNILLNSGTYTYDSYIFEENVIDGIPYQPAPSTPSVPTSATAQENTNPYTVDVYLYGGTVTEIQITKNGTAYTVFSNSSGLALSGQGYRLQPGDSITVTYTTAPTWVWLGE